MPTTTHLGLHPAARLTQTDGSPVILRPDCVAAVRATPDGVVIHLTGGEEITVEGTLDEVLTLLRGRAAPNPDDPVSVLGLSSRAALALDAIGVRTIRDLLRQTAQEVRQAHNCGPRTLAEIQASLAAHGLNLRTGSD